MPDAPMSIASASGLVFGFWFLLVLTGLIGFSVAVLGWRVPQRFPELRVDFPRTLALLLGGGLFVILFGGIYVTSLAGFHAVEPQDDGVILHYALPPIQIGLAWHEIGEVRREPSFRNQWRLVFHRTHGARYGSVNGSYLDVKRAWMETARRLERLDEEGMRDGDAVLRDD